MGLLIEKDAPFIFLFRFSDAHALCSFDLRTHLCYKAMLQMSDASGSQQPDFRPNVNPS